MLLILMLHVGIVKKYYIFSLQDTKLWRSSIYRGITFLHADKVNLFSSKIKSRLSHVKILKFI